ncbi:HIT family protein [Paraburkholderia caballeronis]|uniref:HIT family protein n=1 Tax=Paraburkholderia caballeronis TaxID=416943 RepID=UPI001065199D|nr:HIT family protein [Paraburkholderia caballeronis]
MLPQCPFCKLPADRIIDHNDAGVAVRDAYPVSPGHTLIISSRHVSSLFELSTVERERLLSLVDRAKRALDEQYQPDAYNIGINDGIAAGQTVPHFHIHLIPRYKDDLPEPRGGVRWVIPKKANYWSK